MKQKYWLAIVLASLCIGGSFALTQTHSAGVGEYNPWADINDDGKVNILDCIQLANTFGTSGTPLTKASVEYDSGWINVTGQFTATYTITHNLNMTHGTMLVDTRGHASLGWDRLYGWEVWRESVADLVQATDGGYIMAGYTEYGAGIWDLLLIKVDSMGNEQWNKTYGGADSEHAEAIIQTGDGGYAIAGDTHNYGAGDSDFWLVRTDSSGNALWNKTYGGLIGDVATDLVQTVDGGYALVGRTLSFGAGGWDFRLVKTDPDGTIEWSRTYGGIDDDLPWALVQTSDGGYAMSGDTNSTGAGNWDYWLVKTDALGNMEWNKTYGGTGSDVAWAGLVQTVDGGYAIGGDTHSYGAGLSDFWLVKADANGNEQWNKTYGGVSWDPARDICCTSDGGYAMTGHTYNFGAGIYDLWIVKTDANGDMMWDRRYGGTEPDSGEALIQSSDGGYAIAGYTDSFGLGGAAWLIKTDATGKIDEEAGLAWVDSTPNTITLYRGETDPYWNYVRVRILKQKQTP